MAIPPFEQQDIEQTVGRRNLREGWEYYRSGAIVHPRRQAMTLAASCIGTSRTPYEVEVTFDDAGLALSRCTCPIGESGHCKHVGALLVAWLESPQAFVVVEPWDAVLGRLTRRDLIDLLLQLMERRPELERAVEALLPAQKTTSEIPTLEACRRQVAELMAQADDEPGAAGLAARLAIVKEAADRVAQQHESAAAAAMYQALVEGLLGHPQQLDVRRPELVELLDQCVEGMGLCLVHLGEDVEARQGVLRTLLDLYRFELTLGGVAPRGDLSRTILAHVTKDDRRLMADFVRAMLPGVPAGAARRALGGLLLELVGSQIEEPELFDLCRRTDRIFELVRRLVCSDRLDQALEEAPKADDYELVKIADLLVRCRQDDAAHGLVRQRMASSTQPALGQWLDDCQARRRQVETLLDLAGQLFRMQPSFSGYRQVRALARQIGRWDALRPELLAFVERAKHLSLLVRIHVEENDVDRALEVVTADRSAMDEGLAVRVAQAAQRSRPREALEVYRAVAERLIGRRGREDYVEACRYLRKVRALLKRTGGLREWKIYLDDLHRRHPSLLSLDEASDRQRPGTGAAGGEEGV